MKGDISMLRHYRLAELAAAEPDQQRRFRLASLATRARWNACFRGDHRIECPIPTPDAKPDPRYGPDMWLLFLP
ncbi:hypothetical protein MTX26_01700 [Bradyrhizobium sp. ISRA443]|uniref:hypothetical protein n=1 Tax=unclassified Bradyrhizobium TaxID=2631580 RepID=UPI002478E14E|nr:MULTISPECIES: hypothetical protein [unclassified Bradyrhizobium]WGR94784.1 hypothetical protein MTX20_11740 [Bradyrhizobium sp. ISRA435]WGR99613.1 hypothetical protein MTX23_01700 [Bradyrhizobium sp. ISRA436]WGS06503.1 hypothetical protein MTX18_01700 [Bradyrhizobium sp. ISRA437]WGS13387.1 hypothetical protein MTX26_01700 [Bradyrhizobium sp. ISRA443]